MIDESMITHTAIIIQIFRYILFSIPHAADTLDLASFSCTNHLLKGL